MEVTSLYDYTKRFTEPQLQFQSALEYPTDFWENYLSDISKGALKSFDIKCPALPDMFWLNKLPIGSSQYIAQDAEDRINEKCASSANSDNISSGQIIRRTSKDSTSSADLNRMNEEFHSSLSKRTQTFVWTLQHIDFEDGVENDIIKEVEGYIKTNRFVTYLWLHSIYSNNQKDIDVLAGLLRIIGMTVEKE